MQSLSDMIINKKNRFPSQRGKNPLHINDFRPTLIFPLMLSAATYGVVVAF